MDGWTSVTAAFGTLSVHHDSESTAMDVLGSVHLAVRAQTHMLTQKVFGQ